MLMNDHHEKELEVTTTKKDPEVVTTKKRTGSDHHEIRTGSGPPLLTSTRKKTPLTTSAKFNSHDSGIHFMNRPQ